LIGANRRIKPGAAHEESGFQSQAAREKAWKLPFRKSPRLDETRASRRPVIAAKP
jgi:hypothetical protein